LFVARARADYFNWLLRLDDIDRLLTTLDVNHPGVCLANASRSIPSDEYTIGGGAIDIPQLYRLHDEGATIILNQLDRRHPPLAELCAALELEFSARFQANVYVTPPRAQGFPAHFDTHDVFVLQLHGSKHWRLYDTPIALPVQGQADDADANQPGDATNDFMLGAGDTLYIPRGLVHDAVSGEELSVHATIGVLSYTWADVMLEAMAHAILSDPAMRRSLPRGFARVGFDSGAAQATFRDLAERFCANVHLDPLLQEFSKEFVDRHPVRLRGQMAQLARVRTLTLESMVGRRPHIAYALHEDAATIRIRCYRKEISVPSHAAAAVRHALDTDRFRVGDLPGESDEESKLALIRRLVREGLLMIVDGDERPNAR
jgi:ribosomal protein L16 Arg81 hydroxylase